MLTSHVCFVTAPSVPPKGLSTLAINATALRLSWNTLKKNATNGLLTQFSLWLMRIDTSEETAKNVSARLTVAVVNDLKPFANYSVRVAAVNKAGFGPISQAVVQEMPQAGLLSVKSTTYIGQTNAVILFAHFSAAFVI